MSGFIFAPSSVDLTAPPTNIGTTTPPAITASTIFRSGNSGNIPFVAQPFGTGAFQLQAADSTATGGNARGTNAIDLQTARGSALDVASGGGSVVLGFANRATATYSVAIGASNQSSSISTTAIGNSNIADGYASTAIGYGAITKSIANLFAFGATEIFGTGGKSQHNILPLGTTTTNATPTILASRAAVSASNQLLLQNNSALAFTGLVIASIVGGGNTSAWEFKGAIKRGANAASTALIAAVTPTLISQDAGASTWAVAVTANTTDGCLAVTVTGQASTTIRWVCTIHATEVAF